MLKLKGFIMLENPLVALAATSYVIVFNGFCSIYLLFCFCASFSLKHFWAYSFDIIVDTLLRGFEMILYPCQ